MTPEEREDLVATIVRQCRIRPGSAVMKAIRFVLNRMTDEHLRWLSESDLVIVEVPRLGPAVTWTLRNIRGNSVDVVLMKEEMMLGDCLKDGAVLLHELGHFRPGQQLQSLDEELRADAFVHEVLQDSGLSALVEVLAMAPLEQATVHERLAKHRSSLEKFT